MQDLIGGQIQLMFDNLASALVQVRAGKVKALAVTLNLGAEPVGSTLLEFAAYIRSEAAKYARVIKASGAKAH